MRTTNNGPIRRGARTSRGGMMQQRTAVNRPKFQITMFSSNEYSDSDDIPLIKSVPTLPNGLKKKELLSELVVDETNSSNSYSVELTPSNSPNDSISDKEDNRVGQEVKKPPTRSPGPVKPPSRGGFQRNYAMRRRPIPRNHGNDKVAIQEKENKEEEKKNVEKVKEEINQETHNEDENEENMVNKLKPPCFNSKIERLLDKPAVHIKLLPAKATGELKSYRINRETKLFSRKEGMVMLENDIGKYFSCETKDQIGKYHIISSSLPCELGSSGYCGYVRCVDNENFLLISKEELPNDDREGELCGFHISKTPLGKKKTKSAKIALTANGQPNFATCKRLSLASIADNETSDAGIDTIKFVSKPQSLDSKGKPVIEFEDVYMVPSEKNILITDSDGAPIYVLFKTSDSTFGLRCRSPISPLVAFSLSIALISS